MFWNLIIDMINFIIRGLGALLAFCFSILPSSPFRLISNSEVSEYMGYINWLIPFDLIIAILQMWLVAIATYYVVMTLLRWVKVLN